MFRKILKLFQRSKDMQRCTITSADALMRSAEQFHKNEEYAREQLALDTAYYMIAYPEWDIDHAMVEAFMVSAIRDMEEDEQWQKK
jgi:hypothetical protein